MPTVIIYTDEWIDDGRNQKHRGCTANYSQCLQATVATVIRLMASSILANILLSCYPSLCRCGFMTVKLRARSSACIDYITICAVPRPSTGLLSWNLEPQKLILRAFSDFSRKLAPPKITCHMVSYILIRFHRASHFSQWITGSYVMSII